jgi:TFIIF-interacting CTD phosphatase-like protein
LNHLYNKKLVSKKLVPTREYDSDLVVVLDLNECLIHSQFVKGHAGANYAHQVFRSDHEQSPDEKSSSVNTFKTSLPDGELVRVHERPYLQEFLPNFSERYETHIFYGQHGRLYARPILNALDPHGTIFSSYRFREYDSHGMLDRPSTDSQYVLYLWIVEGINQSINFALRCVKRRRTSSSFLFVTS